MPGCKPDSVFRFCGMIVLVVVAELGNRKMMMYNMNMLRNMSYLFSRRNKPAQTEVVNTDDDVGVVKSSKQKLWVIFGFIILVAVIFFTTEFSSLLGTRALLGKKFKILGPSAIQAGQAATITWDVSTENAKKYPYEKIEYCYGSFLKQKCAVLAAIVRNTGKAVVKVPSNLPKGKGYLKLTARDAQKKFLGNQVSKSNKITVQPAGEAHIDNGGRNSSVGGGSSGGGNGGGGESSSGNDAAGSPLQTPEVPSVATELQIDILPKHQAGASYIVYNDSLHRAIKLASNVSGTWQTAILAPTRADIELGKADVTSDSQGAIHMSYGQANALAYATNSSGKWRKQVVASLDANIDYIETSIAVDDANHIHISFSDLFTNPSDGNKYNVLKYATNTSGQWVTAVADSTLLTGKNSEIAVDGNGKVHIIYSNYNSPNGDLLLSHVNNTTGSWNTMVLGTYWGRSSIAPGKNNEALVVYADDSNILKYARYSSGHWIISTIGSTDEAAEERGLALAVEASGNAHVIYSDQSDDHSFPYLYYANLENNWDVQEVGITGDDSAIAIDVNDKLHVGYVDRNHGIRYVTNASGAWETTPVDVGESDLYFYPSIAVSP